MEYFLGGEKAETVYLWQDISALFQNHAFACGIQTVHWVHSGPDEPDVLVLSTHPDDDTEDTLQLWRYYIDQEDIVIIKYIDKSTYEADAETADETYTISCNTSTNTVTNWDSGMNRPLNVYQLAGIRKDIGDARWDADWSQSVAAYEKVDNTSTEQI